MVGRFNNDAVKRIRRTVKRVEAMPQYSTVGRREFGKTPNLTIKVQFPVGGVPARVGTTAGGPVTAQAVFTNTDGVIADIDGFTPEVWNMQSVVVGASDDRYGLISLHSDGKFFAGTSSETTGAIIPVDMIVSGGLDGTETIRASWRYTVYRFGSGEVLRSDVDPNSAPHKSRIRGTIGSVVVANFGLAYFTNSSELIICYCNETRADEACP